MREFREYLRTSDELADFRTQLRKEGQESVFSLNLTELKEKLNSVDKIDPKSLEEAQAELEAEGENEVDSENTEEVPPEENSEELSEEDLTMAIIDDLLNDEEIRSILDADANEEISKEELLGFLTQISSYDENSDDVSMDDIEKVFDEIEAGNFVYTMPPVETMQTDEDPAKITTGPSYHPPVSQSAVRNPKTLNLEELQAKKAEAEADLQEKQADYQAIVEGNYTKDSNFENLKTAQDEAKQAYYDEFDKTKDPENFPEFVQARVALENKEKELQQNEVELLNQAVVVSQAQSALNSAKSVVSNLEGIVSSLQGSEASEEQESQLAAAQSQLEAAKQAQEQAQTALDEAEDKFEELKNKKTELEQEKTELENNKNEIENEVVKNNPVLQELKENWENAKNALEEYQDSLKANALNAVQEVQAQIEVLDTQITERINKKNQKDLSLTTEGEKVVEFAKQFMGKNSSEMLAIMRENGYQFDGGLWCADFVSFCMGMTLGEDALPQCYKQANRAWCEGLMKTTKELQLDDIRDAQPGDMVLLGKGGTGKEHAAIFGGWLDEEHNRYFTVERCGVNGYDGVGSLERTVASGDIGAIVRIA
ncbi:hypothetical protein IJ670_01470 [bacterium]|nr:hypothetical protein [bacterium]